MTDVILLTNKDDSVSKTKPAQFKISFDEWSPLHSENDHLVWQTETLSLDQSA